MLISNRFCSWDFAHYHKWEKQNNHNGNIFFYHWQVLLPVMVKWENTTMGHTYSNCQQWQTITNHWEWYTQTVSISKTSKPHGGQIQNLEERGRVLGSARNSPLMHHWTRHLQTMQRPGRIKNCDFCFFSLFLFVFVCGDLTFDSYGFFGHEQRKCLKGPAKVLMWDMTVCCGDCLWILKVSLIHCDKKESKICLSKANSRNSQNEAVQR